MKLVIDARLINASGVGTYLKNIIPGIIHAFDEVLLLGNNKELKLFDWAENIKIIEFNAKIYSLEEQIKYPFIIPSCDVLWCPFFNTPIFPVKAGKIITTIHDVYHLTEIASLSFAKKKAAKLLFTNAVRKSNLVLTVSEFSKSEILKYLKTDSQKIEVVYCGVDRTLFLSPKKGNIELPENYILYVGNIKPHKNLITLLKAFNTFSNEFKSKYPLVLTGKKEGFITKDNEIDIFIKSNDLEKYITFTGYVSDSEIPNIYLGANLFVFPSLYEGFGLPVLEALAASAKVISSNAASLCEVGGNAVIYFDPKKYEELAELIKKHIDKNQNDNHLIIEREKQLEKFTWQKVIEKHLEAFKK